MSKAKELIEEMELVEGSFYNKADEKIKDRAEKAGIELDGANVSSTRLGQSIQFKKEYWDKNEKKIKAWLEQIKWEILDEKEAKDLRERYPIMKLRIRSIKGAKTRQVNQIVRDNS